MTTRHTLTALAVIFALHGTNAVSDTNGIPPYYDEETATVVYHFVSTPVSSVSSHVSICADHRIPPYYEEDTDPVVYRFVGRPFTQTTAMTGVPE